MVVSAELYLRPLLLLEKISDFLKYIGECCKMFVCLSVCMFALHRSQFSSKNSQKIHVNCVSDLVGVELFSEVKVKGQGHRSPNIENHLLDDNS